MKNIENDIHINARPKAVYEFLMDTERAPAWIPSMLEVHNIKGKSVGKTYEWTYRMAGVPVKGKSKVTIDQPKKRLQTQSQTGIKSTWDYFLEEEGEGTRFRLRVQYQIPAPVLQNLAENLLLKRNQREAELAMKNIKEMVEHSAKKLAAK